MGTDVRLAHRINLPWRRTVVIADAHMLMRAATRMYRTNELPLALQLAATGRARILVAPHIPGEVVRRLPRLAHHHDLPVEDLLEIWWTEVAPQVGIVELPRGEYLNPLLRPVRTDTDDVPTAALAIFVAPSVVWSEDHSLIDAGLADPAAGPVALDVAVREADWAENSAAAALGINLAGVAITGLVRAAIRRPGVAAAGIAGLALLAYLADLPERLSGDSRARWASSMRRGTSDLLSMIGKAYAELEVTRERLPVVHPIGLETPDEASARVLADRMTPMPLRALYNELHRRRPTAELVTYRPPSMAALRRQLAGSPSFVRNSGDQWSIGVPVPAWCDRASCL